MKIRRRKAKQPMPGKRALASAVVTRRGELGLTQAGLAAKAGVSHRAVQYLEAGTTMPQPLKLAAIARALKMDAAELRRIAEGEPAKATT